MESHDIILGGVFLLNIAIVCIGLAISILRFLLQPPILQQQQHRLPPHPQPQIPRLWSRPILGDCFTIWIEMVKKFCFVSITLDLCTELDRELELGDRPGQANRSVVIWFILACMIQLGDMIIKEMLPNAPRPRIRRHPSLAARVN